MFQISFEENFCRNDLYPFTQTRPVADIRVGILTIREKWQMHLTQLGAELSSDIPFLKNWVIPANLLPDTETVHALISGGPLEKFLSDPDRRIQFPWDIIHLNAAAICSDYALITQNRQSAGIPGGVTVIGSESVFIESGARVSICTINASTGPVYIGRNAEIMEGTMIRGPFALGENSVVKMGSMIYGGTSIGPGCVAGGEIKNSVLFEYSNKAHHGYLGDSVIGAWCNLGAGSSNSNLSNTAGDVQVYHRASGAYKNAGLKCGLIMGDFSVAAINTSFNTGTIAGVACNLFGSGLTPKYMPDFSWGYHSSIRYRLEKALINIDNWKKLKGQQLSSAEIQQLKLIFEQTI